MGKRAIIFGTASFAEVVFFYLSKDSEYQVVAFSSTAESQQEHKFCGLPVVPFETLQLSHPPDDHHLFVAVGYRQLNQVRERFCREAKTKGYKLLSYVCSKTTHWDDTSLGENVFVFEDNTIQPFCSIGDGTVLWSGNHIGHHASIGSYTFISSHVVVSGHCRIGSHCFLGVNATISDAVSVGDRNIIGPSALIQKDTGSDEVYLTDRTPRFPKNSSRFMR